MGVRSVPHGAAGAAEGRRGEPEQRDQQHEQDGAHQEDVVHSQGEAFPGDDLIDKAQSLRRWLRLMCDSCCMNWVAAGWPGLTYSVSVAW